MITVVFSLMFFRFLTILKFTDVVSVDSQNKTVTLKNILTRREKIFLAKDFDGYYDAIKISSYGSHKELLLIKNDKVISIISSQYSSNYQELLKSIVDITFLGTLVYSFQDKIRMLFNKDIF